MTERAVSAEEKHTYTDGLHHRYEASYEPESGQWHTGYTDQEGVWHDVPANEMPLQAFTDEQLETLKYSDRAGLTAVLISVDPRRCSRSA